MKEFTKNDALKAAEKVKNYEEIKNDIFLTPVDTRIADDKTSFKSNIPGVSYRCYINDSEFGANVTIAKNLLKHWGKSEKEVFDKAVENIKNHKDEYIIDSVMPEPFSMDILSQNRHGDGLKKSTNIIFTPDVLCDIIKKEYGDGSYYLAPISNMEFMVHKKDEVDIDSLFDALNGSAHELYKKEFFTNGVFELNTVERTLTTLQSPYNIIDLYDSLKAYPTEEITQEEMDEFNENHDEEIL